MNHNHWCVFLLIICREIDKVYNGFGVQITSDTTISKWNEHLWSQPQDTRGKILVKPGLCQNWSNSRLSDNSEDYCGRSVFLTNTRVQLEYRWSNTRVQYFLLVTPLMLTHAFFVTLSYTEIMKPCSVRAVKLAALPWLLEPHIQLPLVYDFVHIDILLG